MFGMTLGTIIFGIVCLGIPILIIKAVVGSIADSMSKTPTHLCTNCNGKIKPKKVTQGSTLTEIVLWCFFAIPGLIYSMWRLTSKKIKCPDCNSDHFVKLGTEAAKRLESKTA